MNSLNDQEFEKDITNPWYLVQLYKSLHLKWKFLYHENFLKPSRSPP